MLYITCSDINYSITPIQRVLASNQNAKMVKPSEWMAKCPCHQDNVASLHITERQDGTILLKCHAGCPTVDIVANWGLEMKDLFPLEMTDKSARETKEKATTYDYRDCKGSLIYQTVRYEPKGFKQRRPDDNGDWIWNLQGIEPLPYRLPELQKALQAGKMILICEGEKDCDNLSCIGLTATCNHGGAGKWRNAHTKYFPAGSKVTILPDNDEVGFKHAESVATQLTKNGCEVRIIELLDLPKKGDVSDWLATGNTRNDLLRIIEKEWAKPSTGQAIGSETTAETKNMFKPVITCLEDIQMEEIDWLWERFIPRRKITMLEGDPGEGKTFVALAIIAAVTNGWAFPDESGKPPKEAVREAAKVIYMTAEDGLADTIKPRLAALEADQSKVFILEGFSGPDAGDLHAVTLKNLEVLRSAFEQIRPALAVIDPLQAYLGPDVDMHRANEVRPVLTGILHLAEEFNIAVVLIRHLNKASGGKALYRGMGSIDFNAAARSVLLVGRDPDDKTKRVIVQTKASLSEEAPAIGFTLDRYGFCWTGVSDLTAEKVLSNPGEDAGGKSALDEATEFLMDTLCHGPVPVYEAKKQAKNADISEATLRRAREKLGVKPFRSLGNDGAWHWELPKQKSQVAHQIGDEQDDQHVPILDNSEPKASCSCCSGHCDGQHGCGRSHYEIEQDLWNNN